LKRIKKPMLIFSSNNAHACHATISPAMKPSALADRSQEVA
jgi:hypothetical protein